MKFMRLLFAAWFNSLMACIAPGFASVMLTDAIIPAVYLSYTGIDSPELTAFWQSGVVVRNQAIDSAFQAGGTTANLPFWNDLDATIEPNYSTDNPADIAVPDKINAGLMIARVANINKGFSSADLIQQLAGSDPMKHIRNRFAIYWQRQWQRRLIAACQGILANNIASNASDMVDNIALETTVGQTSANLFSRNAFTDAALTLGDQFTTVVAIAVHSTVYGRMVKNDDIQFIRPSVIDPNVPLSAGQPYFLGKPVIIDDSLPVVPGTTSGFKYTSVLYGQGAIGYGEAPVPVPVETYRRPEMANGGGIEMIWERKSMIIHPFGYQFTSGAITGLSPTLAELRAAANWSRVVVRKNVPMAFLITNG